MKARFLLPILAASFLCLSAASVADRQNYRVIVDESGVMRRSDNGAEVAYYGTNYTLPFAHGYRALGYLGKDRKEAIRNDVYHISRLGLNAFRLHLWDAELADSLGNLLDSDHLDLLDYLIAEMEKNGIDVILTAQTNFGNGYPERDRDTGSFTYDFPKCEIHDNPAAQKIQSNYLTQLVNHKNPYTGLTYAGDNAIIALEINNEPCHSGSRAEVTAYIDSMAASLRSAGFDKPLLYNVSHNPQVTAAYYDAAIDGTTYQWYPTGLVAGHTRKGNFLPAVDNYTIAWRDTMPRYGSLARVVYEFDPGDVLYSHLYPAIVRTMRKEGFQWITQFAYDPLELAPYNTEYQTHYLNLAYTPAKALSMSVAAEAMREIPRGADFGPFPKDTVFGNFRVSYEADLSEYNSPEKFIYTNTTATAPRDPKALKSVAGHGSSPAVEYDGTGAYFLDRRADGTWRLEVMPDVILIADPFRHPGLDREVARVYNREQPMRISLPSLGKDFSFKGINEGNTLSGKASDGRISVLPGVYLLGSAKKLAAARPDSAERRFVAPEPSTGAPLVVHNPAPAIERGDSLTVRATVASAVVPDSVLIYPKDITFWRTDNPIVRMRRTGEYEYDACIPAETWMSDVAYNIVPFVGGKASTFPVGNAGTPLDWDAPEPEYYRVPIAESDQPVSLLTPELSDPDIDVSSVPGYIPYVFRYNRRRPAAADFYSYEAKADSSSLGVIRRYAGDNLKGHPFVALKDTLVVDADLPQGAEVAVYTRQGGVYAAPAVDAVIPLSAMRPATRLIVPDPFPTFLPRETEPVEVGPLRAADIESVEIRIPLTEAADASRIRGLWLR